MMASTNTQDEIIDLTNRYAAGKVKPHMRVDSAMIKDSVIGRSLPDFLGRLARANKELDANQVGSFELTEEEAASQQHIEMDLYAGIMEKAKSTKQNSRVKLPTDHDSDSEAIESDSDASLTENHDEQLREEDSSSAESLASSSTEASQLTNGKKRKAISLTQVEDMSNGPRKTRIVARKASPALSTSSGSSIGSTRVIRIKVPSKSPSSEDSDSGSSASSGRRIIKLKDPRKSPSPRPTKQSPSRNGVRINSRTSPPRTALSEPSDSESARSSSPSSESSSSSRRIRIKVVSPQRQGGL